MALFMVAISSVLFFATHLLLSHGRIRESLVRRLGEWPFRGVYSLISLGTLGAAVLVFWKWNDSMGEALWPMSSWLLVLVWPLVLLGLLLLVLMAANPSPAGMAPASFESRGVLRITRHPMNMGIASWALGHMIANSEPGELFLFGSLFAVGFFGAYHQDRRKAREKGEEFRKFQRNTSVLPFAAIVTGKTRLKIKEFSFIMLGIAVAAFIVLLYFHQRLFGVAPY